VEISNGGTEAWGGFDVRAAVSVDNDARLRLTNSTITAQPDPDVATLNAYALAVQPRGDLPGFENNELLGDARFPDDPFTVDAYIPDKLLGFQDASSPTIAVVVYATIGIQEPVTVTIPDPEVTGKNYFYIMDGMFDVNASFTIRHETPDAGAIFQFSEGSGMRINDGGALLTDVPANSDDSDETIFEGVRAVPGYWRGILFRAEDRTSELENVRVAYGGRESWGGVQDPANISVLNSRLTLTNSTIHNSAGWGVFLQGDDRVVFNESNNTFRDNTLGPVGADN